MKNLHLGLGLVLLAVFLFTGDYMQVLIGDDAAGALSLHRMMLRASHIYILFLALLNLLLGGYWQCVPSRLWRRVQMLASALMVLGSALGVYAFFIEAVIADEMRALTFWTVVCILGGTMLHVISVRWPTGADR